MYKDMKKERGLIMCDVKKYNEIMGDVVSQHHPKSHPDILFQYQGNLN